MELSSAQDLTLTKALGEYDLAKFENVISKEGEKASKEYQIEKALQNMEDAWNGVNFDIDPYKETSKTIEK